MFLSTNSVSISFLFRVETSRHSFQHSRGGKQPRRFAPRCLGVAHVCAVHRPFYWRSQLRKIRDCGVAHSNPVLHSIAARRTRSRPSVPHGQQQSHTVAHASDPVRHLHGRPASSAVQRQQVDAIVARLHGTCREPCHVEFVVILVSDALILSRGLILNRSLYTHLSPHEEDRQENLSTLKYGDLKRDYASRVSCLLFTDIYILCV